jgi:hypothetical protein
MSDDTPTERFDPVDKPQPTPTMRLPAADNAAPAEPTSPTVAAPAATTSWTTGPNRPRRAPGSRGPLIAFVILAILVVAAIIVLIVLLAENGSPAAAPTSSPTTSASATSTPTPPSSTPTPVAPAAPTGTFVAFAPLLRQTGCNFHGDQTGAPIIRVSWTTENASSVWVAEGTSDAADAGTMQVPLSGNQSNFPMPLRYDCSKPSNTFTMTLVDANGAHTSETWTVTAAVRKHDH